MKDLRLRSIHKLTMQPATVSRVVTEHIESQVRNKRLPTHDDNSNQSVSICASSQKSQFPGRLGSDKESACNAGDVGSIPGLEDPLEKGKPTHSSVLAWRIPWTQSMGSQTDTTERLSLRFTIEIGMNCTKSSIFTQLFIPFLKFSVLYFRSKTTSCQRSTNLLSSIIKILFRDLVFLLKKQIVLCVYANQA